MDLLADHIENLEDLLNQEITAVMDFQNGEREVKSALSGRNWSGLEIGLKMVEAKALNLEVIENKRQEAWNHLKTQLQASEEFDFYGVMSLLPPESRARLTDLRRRLKVAVVGLKAFTSGLGDYVNTSSALISAAVHEIRPSLKGQLYSPQGQIKPTQAASLVLDRHF